MHPSTYMIHAHCIVNILCVALLLCLCALIWTAMFHKVCFFYYAFAESGKEKPEAYLRVLSSANSLLQKKNKPGGHVTGQQASQPLDK